LINSFLYFGFGLKWLNWIDNPNPKSDFNFGLSSTIQQYSAKVRPALWEVVNSCYFPLLGSKLLPDKNIEVSKKVFKRRQFSSSYLGAIASKNSKSTRKLNNKIFQPFKIILKLYV